MKMHLKLLFWIVIVNYIAQIPYDLHLYGFHGANWRGGVLLGLTFLLFIIPYTLLAKRKNGGYIGILVFLSIEFLFYLLNFIGSIAHGYGAFFQLRNPDPILFTAFLIGYINFIAAGYFLFYFLKNQQTFISHAY